MELFKQTKINWLGKKWWFASVSIGLFIIGIAAYFVRGGFNYGIDFTGGTIILLKFNSEPDLNKLRDALRSESAAPPTIQRYGLASNNSVQVRMQRALGTGTAYEKDKNQLIDSLRNAFDPAHVGSSQKDFNSVGDYALRFYLLTEDPDGLRRQNKTIQEVESYYDYVVAKIHDYRTNKADGLVASLDQLQSAGVSTAAVNSIKNSFYAGPFAIKGLESIGAIVGSDLRRRASWAILASLLAMLVYIAFRFKPIYGVAAIIALIHDVTITLGLFALTQKEISLTVIAALLTLVGYSVNDTIVIFDRVRENLRLMRKESLFDVLNLSVNQTLSRTIMTSGFTFIAVFCLFLFGGEVLNGFSFALTVGIILGSYSTIALASTIVEWWYRNEANKPKRKSA